MLLCAITLSFSVICIVVCVLSNGVIKLTNAKCKNLILNKGFHLYHWKNARDRGPFCHSGFYFCETDPRGSCDLFVYTLKHDTCFPILFSDSNPPECRVAEFVSEIGCRLNGANYLDESHYARGVTNEFLKTGIFAACSGAKSQHFSTTIYVSGLTTVSGHRNISTFQVSKQYIAIELLKQTGFNEAIISDALDIKKRLLS